MSLRRTPAAPWHRVDVCCRDALARTSISVLGVLDSDAIETVDRAIATADAQRHTLTLELREISSVTPQALDALLSRVARARPVATLSRVR